MTHTRETLRTNLVIRREAFRILLESFELISNDVFVKFDVLFTTPRPIHWNSILEFFEKYILVENQNGKKKKKKKRRGSAIQEEIGGESDENEIELEVVGLDDTGLSKGAILSSNKRRLISNHINTVNTFFEDEIREFKPDKRKRNRGAKQQTTAQETDGKQELERKHLLEEYQTIAGQETLYFLTLKLFTLFGQSSLTIGGKIFPPVALLVSRNLKTHPQLKSILLSFANRELNKDVQGKANRRLWQLFLRAGLYGGNNAKEGDKEAMVDLAKIFIGVYHKRITELRKNAQVDVSVMLQEGGERAGELNLAVKEKVKELNTQYLDFVAHLIKRIEIRDESAAVEEGKIEEDAAKEEDRIVLENGEAGQAAQEKRNSSRESGKERLGDCALDLLVKVWVKEKYFESRGIYEQILLTLFTKLQELSGEGEDKLIKMGMAFVKKEIEKGKRGSARGRAQQRESGEEPEEDEESDKEGTGNGQRNGAPEKIIEDEKENTENKREKSTSLEGSEGMNRIKAEGVNEEEQGQMPEPTKPKKKNKKRKRKRKREKARPVEIE